MEDRACMLGHMHASSPSIKIGGAFNPAGSCHPAMLLKASPQFTEK